MAAGLKRLEPHSREVLELSLRRRIPDDMLGRLLDADGPEIARRRAAAIQELAAELGVARGTELGRVLNLLLEPETWEALSLPEAPRPTGEPSAEEVDDERGLGTIRRWTSTALVAAGTLVLAAAVALAVAARDAGDRAEGQGTRGAEEQAARGGDQPAARGGPARPRPFVPRPGALGAPFPSSPQQAVGHLTASIARPVALLAQPGGRRLATVGPRTEYGSARVLGVVRRLGPWLAVQAPELRNDQVGWVRADEVTLGQVPFALRADLSSRRLSVFRNGREIRRMPVTIGRRRNPTPTGRFSVTDRLLVTDPTSPYGCCVLALSGHQPKLPPDWPGGDRLAVHANADPVTLGHAASLGCLRVDPAQARWLVDRMPLGTPVRIAD